QTLPHDTTDTFEIKQVLNQLAERVEERLQRRELKGKTVQLMIRFSDRQTITRSRKLNEFLDDKETMMFIIEDLLSEHWNGEPIRLLGITVQDLLEKQYVVEQLDLFSYEEVERKAKMKQTVKDLKAKFGEDTFIRLEEEKQQNDPKLLRTSFQKDFLDDYRSKE